MSLNTFFLPNQKLGEFMLKNDLNGSHLEEKERQDYIDFAVVIAKETAEKYKFLKDKDLDAFFRDSKIRIQYKKGNRRMGNVKTFSEYYSAKKLIVIYEDEIREEMKTLLEDFLPYVESYEETVRLFKLHEFFHHLECHEIGITYQRLPDQLVKRGLFKRKLAFMSLSEIAANVFTKSILGIQERNTYET